MLIPYGGSHAAQRGACKADPGPNLAADIFKMAMGRRMILPMMHDATRCLETGVCSTHGRGRAGCNVGYGEIHVALKAGEDTDFKADQFADALGR